MITEIAQQNSKEEGGSWAGAKWIYRLLKNEWIETSQLYEGLYAVGKQPVGREKPDTLVLAVDPVNFEKPYVKVIDDVSIVHKATPPDLTGRVAHDYPAISPAVMALIGFCTVFLPRLCRL